MNATNIIKKIHNLPLWAHVAINAVASTVAAVLVISFSQYYMLLFAYNAKLIEYQIAQYIVFVLAVLAAADLLFVIPDSIFFWRHKKNVNKLQKDAQKSVFLPKYETLLFTRRMALCFTLITVSVASTYKFLLLRQSISQLGGLNTQANWIPLWIWAAVLFALIGVLHIHIPRYAARIQSREANNENENNTNNKAGKNDTQPNQS